MISVDALRQKQMNLRQTHRWKSRVDENHIVELNIGKMCINGCFHLFETYKIPDDFYEQLGMDCIINYRFLRCMLFKRYSNNISKCEICK